MTVRVENVVRFVGGILDGVEWSTEAENTMEAINAATLYKMTQSGLIGYGVSIDEQLAKSGIGGMSIMPNPDLGAWYVVISNRFENATRRVIVVESRDPPRTSPQALG